MAKNRNATEEDSVERIRAAVASGEIQSAPPDANGNGTAAAKPKPTKRESFLKLARRRQPKLGKVCQALANLARKAQYEYTEEEAGKMVNYAKRQCQLVIDAFAGNVSSCQTDPDAI